MILHLQDLEFLEIKDQNPDLFIHTFGGEDESLDIKEYGIQIGDLTMSDLTPWQMKELGVKIINHLISNGHNFDILDDRNGHGAYLICK